MKQSEEKIIAKAKRVLKDLQGKYFNEKNIEGAWFQEKYSLARPLDTFKDVWSVSINEPVFDTTDFLKISDDTGEPLYIQSKHLIMEIMKDADGKYVEKK